MKRMLLCGFGMALLATVVGAGEGRSVRGNLPTSIAPTLLGQADDIPLPSPLSPVPDPQYTPSGQLPLNQYPSGSYTVQHPVLSDQNYAIPSSSYGVTGSPVEIYQNVKYRGVRNISPCAVATIVQIPDPCNKDACCKTCVNVQICVPPCDPKCVRVTRDGNKVRYDYGKYAVAVKSIGNHVVVHYED